MNEIKRNNADLLLISMILGVVLGVLFGYLFGESMVAIKIFGDLFIKALKAIIVPLIMASIIVGVTSLGNVKKLGKIGGITFTYYAITTCVAVTIGIIVSNIFSPGTGVDITGAAMPEKLQGDHEFNFLALVNMLIPTNLIQSMSSNKEILSVIVCSIVFGAVLTTLDEKGKPVIDFFIGLNAAMMKIVKIIMIYAPFGIFALVASITGEKGVDEILKIWKFIVTVLVGLSIHAFIILPAIFLFIRKKNLFQYARNMGSAFMTAFSTDSSAATLPITMECIEKKNNVSPQTSSFVLPIGATVNMDGTALYEACAVMFIAQAYGIATSFNEQIIVFVTATLASVGAAAIPHAGLVTVVICLSALDLPVEGVGLVWAVDWFLDRCRTTVNVWGDSVGAGVVDTMVSHETDSDREQ
jgi:solute carrier family 1 (high affinity glutamate transporter) protein 1